MASPYRYFSRLRVRFNETDLQGHVNFAWYLNFFDVALTGYLRALGYSYQQMRDDNLDMFYADAKASYNSPSYFDEELRIHCRLGHIGNTSLRFDFQIFAEADERLVTTGEITAVMADSKTGSKLRVPDPLRLAVDDFEQGEIDRPNREGES
jgi:acyl-CoA thioester hydrolase